MVIIKTLLPRQSGHTIPRLCTPASSEDIFTKGLAEILKVLMMWNFSLSKHSGGIKVYEGSSRGQKAGCLHGGGGSANKTEADREGKSLAFVFCVRSNFECLQCIDRALCF